MKANVKKPPIGWNSYDGYSWSITEAEFIKNADVLDKELKPHGFEYAVIDFCWATVFSVNKLNPCCSNADETILTMDEYGRLLPAPNRFPSSSGGKGFKPLADLIHSKGLKFGIHVMRGIPKKAVELNTPIKGTKYFAKDIIRNDGECIWLDQMCGIDMSKPGAQEYLSSIFELYEEWEIDYVKVDDLSKPYHKAEVEGYRKAINECKRPIVFSSSPGETPLSEALHVSENIDLFRISCDFWDRWEDLKDMIQLLKEWQSFFKKGSWPDADMLPFGMLSLRGPVGEPRYSNFTYNEKQLLLTMWIIMSSPIMLGGDLTKIDRETLELLTNNNAFGIVGEIDRVTIVKDENENLILCASAYDKRTCFVAFVNYSEESGKTMEISVKDTPLSKFSNVYDAWERQYMYTDNKSISAFVQKHGAKLFIINE